MFFDIIKVFIL